MNHTSWRRLHSKLEIARAARISDDAVFQVLWQYKWAVTDTNPAKPSMRDVMRAVRRLLVYGDV
jgi:hypothetical protein